MRSTKINFDIFIEIMFTFLLHLLIENFKPESYCFERNNGISGWNGYDFELYHTTFHSKNYHNRLFNSMALFVVYKWPLQIEIAIVRLNEIKVKCLKFYFLNSVAFCASTQIQVDLQLQSFSRVTLGPAFPVLEP